MAPTSSVLAFISMLAVASAGIPVYVMLPLDVVTQSGLTNPTALKSNLQTLKGVGVEGVLCDVWWGLAEAAGPTQYNFTAYSQLASVIESVGLKWQPVMSFHQCGGNVGDTCNVPLPEWVRSVASSHDIFYQDQHGHQDQEYLSLFVDEESLFSGRTPVQMYGDFIAAFKSALSPYFANTITQVEISMGPAGELRYPSYQLSQWKYCGVGEFQVYDSYALAALASAASAAGHPEWGHAGPSNAGTYDSRPSDTGFFSSSGSNNYNSDYGRFFLGFYSSQLLAHGDRVLSAAVKALPGVSVAGKVAGIHWWYKDYSHAAELTAGYYNTNGNDAYAAIAATFAKHGAITFVFTCLEMKDSEQDPSCASGPFELVEQTKLAAKKVGIPYSGENALPRYDSTAYGTIETQATSEGIDLQDFTYLRLSPTLLQSNNLGTFQQFVSTMGGL